jgi:hypothetical protein
MTITVQGPGGISIDFPDDTNGDTINRVMGEAVAHSQTSSKSDEDLMRPQPTGSPAFAEQQEEMRRRGGVLPGTPGRYSGPRMGDALKEMFGGHNPIAETTDNFVTPAVGAIPGFAPAPRTLSDKALQDFQNSRSIADRASGAMNYGASMPVRALTQGEYGVGDILSGIGFPGAGAAISKSEEEFARANAPQLEALQKGGDLAAGTAGVDFARPLRPSPDVHRPQLPDPRASDAAADLQAFKDSDVRPFGPAFSSGPVAGLSKSLADTPFIGAPVRNALEESVAGAGRKADELASRFGNAANDEQAGRAVQDGIERYKDARPDDIVRERMQSDASTASEWAAQNEVGPSSNSFTTAKGSTYEVQPDGTTIRNKAARGDPGHEGDEGLKPASQRTVYVTPEDANKLGEFQAQGGGKRAVDFTSGGQIAVKYFDGKDAGKFERRTAVDFSDQPKVGHIPVELWNDGARVHFGNEITEVRAGSAQKNTNPDQWRNDIIAAPSRETSRKTKAEALYDEAWNRIPPEMQVGRSREGDSRFLGGLGHTANALDDIIDRSLGMMNRARADREGSVEITRAGDEVAPVGRQVAVRGGTIPEAALPVLGGQLGRIVRDIASRQWRGTLQDMRELRSALRRLSSGMPDAEKNTLQKSDVERLRAAVSRDMQYTLERNAKAYLEKGQKRTATQVLRAAQLFKRADEFYRLSQQRIDAIESLFGAKNPEAVYRNAVQAAQVKGGDMTKLRALARILRQGERDELASGILNQLGRPNPSARGFSQEIGFSVNSWLTNWNKLSPEGKLVLFGEEHMRALDQLARVAHRLADVEAQTNSSRSGTHMTNMAALASAATSFVTGNWAYFFGSAATGYGASLLLSRPAYATWAAKYAALRARALSGPTAAIRPLHEQIHKLAVLSEADPRLIPVVIDVAKDNGMDVDPNSDADREGK